MAEPFDPAFSSRAALRRGPDPRTVGGALRIAAILLFAVAGILAIVAAIDAMDGPEAARDNAATTDGASLTGVVVLLLGLLLLACAWMAWTGMTPLGGVLALVVGIILIVLYPTSAGILALLGGLALLVSSAAPARQWT